MTYSEEELISYLCKKVKGIGGKTAGTVAVYLGDLESFFENVDKLNRLSDVRGKQILSEVQINEIKKIAYNYFPQPILDIRKAWINVLVRDFVKSSMKEIESTTLDALLINPFLIKAFGFDDHREVVTFYFYQKVTRSIVTSWGFTVEKLLLCSGAEKSDLAGFDIKIEDGDKEYHFQIKSSPNTMSIEQVRQLNVHIEKIKDISKQIPVLGMTYGKRAQINSQIQSTLINYPDSTLIGKELWDFIAREAGYCKQVLDWIGEVMQLEPADFSTVLEDKKQSLIEDWETQWGTGITSINKILEKYL